MARAAKAKTAPKPKSPGRPSLYTLELGAAICARLTQGEPLAVICRDAGMPDRVTVWRWAQEREDFSQLIASAREDGFDAIAADCLAIANTTVEGIETTVKADGSVETRRGDMLGHRKLQIDTRLKLHAKWDPKRYGDKSSVELTGKDGEALIPPVVQYQLPDNGR